MIQRKHLVDAYRIAPCIIITLKIPLEVLILLFTIMVAVSQRILGKRNSSITYIKYLSYTSCKYTYFLINLKEILI